MDFSNLQVTEIGANASAGSTTKLQVENVYTFLSFLMRTHPILTSLDVFVECLAGSRDTMKDEGTGGAERTLDLTLFNRFRGN